jgi:hypothetical protein
MNATRQRRRPRGWRPLLEVLEDRLVPAAYTVNTLTDTGTGTGLAGDLRYCITQADANPGSTVQFDATVFATPQTITLSGTELPVVTADLTIQGPAAGVTLSGNHQSRVFEIGDDTHKPNVAMSGLTITQGNADNGGGILENGGSVALSSCTVTGNVAGNFFGPGGSGGGVFNGGTLTLSNCTLSANSAYLGFSTGGRGGCLANDGTATLTNCTLSGNNAFGRLTNPDFGTFSPGFGGGIANDSSMAGLQLNNTILTGNSADNAPSDVFGPASGDYDLTGDFSAPGPHSLRNVADPGLAPLGNYGGPSQTMALLPTSPALGAGSVALARDANGNPLTTDQRGLPRVVHNMVDIGAFQFQGRIVVNSTADSNARDNVLTLREALLFANGKLKLADLTPAEQMQVGSDPGEPGSFAVTFDPAVFAASQTITLGGTELPVITTDLTIQGPAAGLTLSGNGKSRIFEIGDTTHKPNVAMSGLTITQGQAAGSGGGILEIGGSLALSGCTLSGNAAAAVGAAGGSGGGISNGGSMTLTNCTLSSNSAGGGSSNDGSAAGGNGGGISNGGSMTLTNCTLTGNSADGGFAGGIFEAGGGRGGGISNGGSMTLTNCTLTGNIAVGGYSAGSGASGGIGGGIRNGGSMTLTDCTFTGNNVSDGHGVEGAVFAGDGGGLENDGTVTLNNSIVAGNSANDIQGNNVDTAKSFNNLIGTGGAGGLANNVNGNQVGVANPLLAPLGNYGGPTQTVALLPGSPAIDAGTAAGAPPTDQRGKGRVGVVDIGAFESQGFTLTVLGGDGQTATAGTAFAATFAVRVTANDAAEPVQGGVLTFTAPDSGASGTFANGQASATATIDATGTATATVFAANGTAGSYAVTASAAGAAPIAFQLANEATATPPPPPPLPPARPTPPGLDASQRFVFHLYTDLLGRPASPAEVNFLGALLDQGFVTRAQLAQFFLQSFEYLARQVDQLYVRLLGRHAEPAAQAVGAAFLAAGGRLGQLEAVLLGSDEYFRRHDGTDAGFLAGLGQDVAGGTLDPSDVSLFQAELATGTPRFVVALQALAEPKAAVARAQLLYQQALGRSASPSEVLLPAALLLSGEDAALLLGLLLSDEYANRA